MGDFADMYSDPYDEAWGENQQDVGGCPGRPKSQFKYDPNFYHRYLFGTEEAPRLVRETDSAYLVSVEEGKFWVPKKLIRGGQFDIERWRVYCGFRREYVDRPLVFPPVGS